MFTPNRYEYNLQFGSGISVPEDSVQQIVQFQYESINIIQPYYFLITAQKTGMGSVDANFQFIDLSTNTLIARIPASGNVSLNMAPVNYVTTTLLSPINGYIQIGVIVTAVKKGAIKSFVNVLNVYVR